MESFYNSTKELKYNIPFPHNAQCRFFLVHTLLTSRKKEDGGRDLFRCGKSHIPIYSLIGGSARYISPRLDESWPVFISCYPLPEGLRTFEMKLMLTRTELSSGMRRTPWRIPTVCGIFSDRHQRLLNAQNLDIVNASV